MKRATKAEVAAPPFAIPKLAKGEIYAGVILNEDGTPAHHLVLLGAKGKPMPWEDAKAWAKKQGGELPTRREQSLLMANAKQHIEGLWHWSSEHDASDSSYAWMQDFSDGGQSCDRTSGKYRARAVRRVPIQ